MSKLRNKKYYTSSSSTGSNEESEDIEWLPNLYDLDNKDRFRVFRAGYTKGVYHSETGLLYKKNGDKGKLIKRAAKVPANTRSKTALDAAKARATQEWEDRQRNDTYRECKKPPKCSPEEWRAQDTRRWPSLCMNFKNIKKDRIVCDEKHPFYGQPKFNGDRILALIEGKEQVLYSRQMKKKEFLDEIKSQCKKLIKELCKRYPELSEPGLDGEMFDPNVKHQHSRSKISRTKNRHEDEDDICYFLFDLQVFDIPFSERFKMILSMKDFIKENCPNIKVSPYKILTSIADMYRYRSKCEKDGYEEGIVLRRPDLLYTTKKDERTLDMIKFKNVQDAEYEVIGFKEGSGDREGCVVWKLQDLKDDEITFNCSHKANVEELKDFYSNGKDYIGKILTVEFSEFSDKGIPIFPIGIRFREDDDLPLPSERDKRKKSKKTKVSSEDD